jgi:hypothetical protein
VSESKYARYIVREAAALKKVGDEIIEAIPEGDKMMAPEGIDTGFRVLCSKKLLKDAEVTIEYGFMTEEAKMGTGEDFHPHKHDYPEIFLFLGTNPKDTADLGAEVEFWIGEGKDMEKVVLNTTSSIYMPPNVAHFPQIWRKVKRPVMTMVIILKKGELLEVPVVRTENIYLGY